MAFVDKCFLHLTTSADFEEVPKTQYKLAFATLESLITALNPQQHEAFTKGQGFRYWRLYMDIKRRYNLREQEEFNAVTNDSVNECTELAERIREWIEANRNRIKDADGNKAL